MCSADLTTNIGACPMLSLKLGTTFLWYGPLHTYCRTGVRGPHRRCDSTYEEQRNLVTGTPTSSVRFQRANFLKNKYILVLCEKRDRCLFLQQMEKDPKGVYIFLVHPLGGPQSTISVDGSKKRGKKETTSIVQCCIKLYLKRQFFYTILVHINTKIGVF